MPGTSAIQIKYEGQRPARIEDWPDLSSEITGLVVRKGVGAMPRFRKTEITDPELTALSAYLGSPHNRKAAARP
ncbi:c-type cytochrome [Sphingobium sp. EP60837]|uniref:c-type cytochrome n=1 Tax=Sphingobium sp. EP60837 TaxID=1855519 RepID=UPI001F37CDEA|nr:cytochrome c [Sphingobium sp. EP60837]